VASGGGTQANPPAAGAGAHANTPGSGWDASFSTVLDPDTAALVAGLKCDPTFQTWTDVPGANENRPINCVTWFQVMAFCIWDGGYLPTDAEWNYAASGGAAQRAYPWSNPASSLTLDDSTYASYYIDTTKQCAGDAIIGCAVTDLVPVGTKPAGDGLWGQSDLGGNVSEWLLDVWQSGFVKPCNDCAQLTPGFLRMVRGGDFYGPASYLRPGHYESAGPNSRYNHVGARCARAP
jgi:sulfatase modifying factor 1